MTKVVVVLIDGLGDVSIDGKTPLETAKTPNLDHLAEIGANGLMDPVQVGLACGSDTAHLSIFGYDPFTYYRGRGAFETLGAGLNMNPGDIAFKSNFAVLRDRIVEKRRADREFEKEGAELCAFLDNLYATEHRCGVCIRGPFLSDQITGTDPLKDNLSLVNCKPLDSSKEAEFSSKLVNALTKEITKRLETHPINQERVKNGKLPANCILLRGCGIAINVQKFEERYGMKGFMIAPTCIIAGLGMTIGLGLKTSATGDYYTNVEAKVEKAVELLKGHYDFGFIHVKAVDDAGHDRNLALKIEFLEKIDRAIGSLLSQIKSFEEEVLVVVTGDHSTPVMYGDHSCEPVPYLIASVNGSSVCPDSIKSFNEIDAAAGSLGRFPGLEFMQIINHYRNMSHKQ